MDPFSKVKELIADLITDLIDMLQSETYARENLFAEVKKLIMDTINRLQSWISHKSYCENETRGTLGADVPHVFV